MINNNNNNNANNNSNGDNYKNKDYYNRNLVVINQNIKGNRCQFYLFHLFFFFILWLISL